MRYWAWMLVLGGMFAVQHRADIQHWLNPPAPIAVPAGFQAILYGAEWCGYCAKTRKMFADRHIPYREYDIEKSTEGLAQYEKLNGNGVPVIVIKGKVIHGFDEAEIEQALRAL